MTMTTTATMTITVLTDWILDIDIVTIKKKLEEKKPIHCCGVLCFHSRTKKRLFYFNGRKAKIRPGLSHIVTLNHTVSVFFSTRVDIITTAAASVDLRDFRRSNCVSNPQTKKSLYLSPSLYLYIYSYCWYLFSRFPWFFKSDILVIYIHT